jgi:hypothetical protein
VQVEGVALEQRLATGGLPSLGRPACSMSSRERSTNGAIGDKVGREAVPLPTVSLEISNGSSLTYLPASRHDVTPGDTHRTLMLSDHAQRGGKARGSGVHAKLTIHRPFSRPSMNFCIVRSKPRLSVSTNTAAKTG